mmetsp:Transcript_22756/g.58026  ORF Transcript_22756/g.58026 Transcript_22756/m.58026 type:complete len:208 (-) Transcript_22756:261-884(-)
MSHCRKPVRTARPVPTAWPKPPKRRRGCEASVLTCPPGALCSSEGLLPELVLSVIVGVSKSRAAPLAEEHALHEQADFWCSAGTGASRSPWHSSRGSGPTAWKSATLLAFEASSCGSSARPMNATTTTLATARPTPRLLSSAEPTGSAATPKKPNLAAAQPVRRSKEFPTATPTPTPSRAMTVGSRRVPSIQSSPPNPAKGSKVGGA